MEGSEAIHPDEVLEAYVTPHGLEIKVNPFITVEYFTEIVIKCSAVLYDAGVQPMEIMLAFQQAAAAQQATGGGSPDELREKPRND